MPHVGGVRPLSPYQAARQAFREQQDRVGQMHDERRGSLEQLYRRLEAQVERPPSREVQQRPQAERADQPAIARLPLGTVVDRRV